MLPTPRPTINLRMLDDRLKGLIGQFGAEAREIRQVARRLVDLLPARYRDIRRSHTAHARGAAADRLALTDGRYIQHLEEVAEIHAQAREARVQYETHMMLLEARRSLRRR